jgi:hypothetical protein
VSPAVFPARRRSGSGEAPMWAGPHGSLTGVSPCPHPWLIGPRGGHKDRLEGYNSRDPWNIQVCPSGRRGSKSAQLNLFREHGAQPRARHRSRPQKAYPAIRSAEPHRRRLKPRCFSWTGNASVNIAMPRLYLTRLAQSVCGSAVDAPDSVQPNKAVS